MSENQKDMIKDKTPLYYPPPDKRRRPVDISPTFEKRESTKIDDIMTSKKAIDPSTESLVNAISKENIEGWINHLASYHTRHTLSRFIDDVANWLMTELKNFGYADVNFRSVSNLCRYLFTT